MEGEGHIEVKGDETCVDVLHHSSMWHLHGVQKVSNEIGRVIIPSSIDVQPMEEAEANAYASDGFLLVFNFKDVWSDQE